MDGHYCTQRGHGRDTLLSRTILVYAIDATVRSKFTKRMDSAERSDSRSESFIIVQRIRARFRPKKTTDYSVLYLQYAR